MGSHAGRLKLPCLAQHHTMSHHCFYGCISRPRMGTWRSCCSDCSCIGCSGEQAKSLRMKRIRIQSLYPKPIHTVRMWRPWTNYFLSDVTHLQTLSLNYQSHSFVAVCSLYIYTQSISMYIYIYLYMCIGLCPFRALSRVMRVAKTIKTLCKNYGYGSQWLGYLAAATRLEEAEHLSSHIAGASGSEPLVSRQVSSSLVDQPR